MLSVAMAVSDVLVVYLTLEEKAWGLVGVHEGQMVANN